MAGHVDVYLEIGTKRTFAGALDWPGWCRSGRDEASALRALVEAGPRYARVVEAAGHRLQIPRGEGDLRVVERLPGGSSTDFGAPDAVPSADRQPLDAAELARLQALLRACWQAFDVAAAAAEGKELRRGPRGGGRDLAGIVQHVLGADRGYVSRLAWKLQPDSAAHPAEALAHARRAMLEALAAATAGKLPERGPRGGKLWPPRYFVRRAAWHELDHAWELEDRVLEVSQG